MLSLFQDYRVKICKLFNIESLQYLTFEIDIISAPLIICGSQIFTDQLVHFQGKKTIFTKIVADGSGLLWENIANF